MFFVFFSNSNSEGITIHSHLSKHGITCHCGCLWSEGNSDVEGKEEPGDVAEIRNRGDDTLDCDVRNEVLAVGKRQDDLVYFIDSFSVTIN